MISILLVLHFASISVLAISVLNFERKLSLELCENAQRSFGEMRQAWTALGSFYREFKIQEIKYIFQDASLTFDVQVMSRFFDFNLCLEIFSIKTL